MANPEVAFYYPNPMWREAGWIKNLLLFFDEVGLLVPNYMTERVLEYEPLVGELHDKKLLRIIEPETFLDAEATRKLATAMTEILASGALDGLAKERTQFAELSFSRIGHLADKNLADMIHEQLKARGLATDSRDGKSIPMHPHVRSLILVLLAQILRPTGKAQGLELNPATDRPDILAALGQLLSVPNMPSTGHVVTTDMKAAGVDLTKVPLDEVVGFRRQHLPKYRRYAQSLRKYMQATKDMNAKEQRDALRERRAEIREEASALTKTARAAWKKPATLALGLAGAIWKTTGDPIAGLLTFAGSLITAESTKGPIGVSAYSYLFAAANDMSGSKFKRFMSGIKAKS